MTDENFYFVMADRFRNGDTANDQGGLGPDRLVSGFDPTSKGFYNGGDLKGVLDELDYIQGLGTDSIWLTPSFKNKAVQLEDGPSAGYHGYWITDFTQIDPHLGTNQDLATLIDAAHDRGMKVYFDIITNHTADVIGYEQGARTAYVTKDTAPYRTASGQVFDDRDYAGTNTFPTLDPKTSFPYTPVLDPGEQNVKVPAWLNDTTLYHNRGNTTFTGEDSQYGDFFGLDDLFTENPKVVDGFVDIYRKWVKDFGVDGFRVDTMKHVDDAFWQKFSPGIVDYAKANGKPNFFMFGEVALDGSGAAAKSLTSHYTTHDDVQAILDFPFQDAARGFASKGNGNAALRTFFENDDWYTDADSNVYELPTFLGNHDMGRIGYFLNADNKGADDAGARRPGPSRPRAHVLLPRQPDRLLRRRAGLHRQRRRPGGPADDVRQQGPRLPRRRPARHRPAPTRRTTSRPRTRSTSEISDLADLTAAHPALRDGAHQMRYASDGPGIVAFSRTDRTEQREYVVALNNSEQPQTASIPTYSAGMGFSSVYGEGPATARTDKDAKLTVTVPPLSSVVYRADGRLARSQHAPKVTLAEPAPAPESHGRMHVRADVASTSFNEVTFQVRSGNGRWTSIGTDDTAPYQVFHDTSTLRTGTPLQYRAVVLDNAGHTRPSGVRSTRVPSPSITVSSPPTAARSPTSTR